MMLDGCVGCINLDIEYYADVCYGCARFYPDKFDDGMTDSGKEEAMNKERKE